MSQENGTIQDGVAGIINRNLDSVGNPVASRGTINYDTSKYSFATGAKVGFDIDDTNPLGDMAINIKPLQTGDPDEPTPYPGGTLKDGETLADVSVPAGQSWTLRACVVNGKVTVGNNARIIISSGKGNASRISKGVKATGAAEVIFYNSVIGGTVVFNNGGKLSAKKGNLQSTVVANSNSGAISFDGVTVDDSLIVNSNTSSVSVTNCTIAGDLILSHNTNCSCPAGSNTVAGENNGCQS